MPPVTSLPLLGPVLAFVGGRPTLLPALLAVGLLALLLARPLGGRLRGGPAGAALLVLAAGLPLALTLVPAPGHVVPLRSCLTAVRPVSDWGRGGEELANLVMLAPLGLLLVLLLPRRAVTPALVAALLLPAAVEAVQYAVPSLGRLCESTDVLLNTVGVVAGAVTGALVRGVLSRRARGRRPHASPRT